MHHVLPFFRRTLSCDQLTARERCRRAAAWCPRSGSNRYPPGENRRSRPLDDGGRAETRTTEPTSGVEPDPPAYETGARPLELHGRKRCARDAATSVQREAWTVAAQPRAGRSSSGRNRTSERPLNRRMPDHSASLECVSRPRGGEPRGRDVGARLSESEGTSRDGALEPGTGFEPVQRASETRVLPLDDPGRDDGARSRAPHVRRTHVVGPEGVEPSPPRSRVECACHYATDRRAHARRGPRVRW